LKLLGRLGLVAVFFLLIGQGAVWMNASGHTWNLASIRLVQHELHQLQDFLFHVRDRKAPLDIVVVGDRTFLTRTVAWLPQDKAVRVINLHRYRIDALSLLFEMMPPDRVGTFIVHHSPLLWSDYRFRGPTQSVELWRNLGDAEFTLFPVKQVRLVFRALKDMAASSADWLTKKHGRPNNLDELSFNSQRPELARLERAIARHKNSRIIWGKDYAGYSRKSNPQLFVEMRVYSRSVEAKKRFGDIISLKDLPSKF
jgi:hypothetical protein